MILEILGIIHIIHCPILIIFPFIVINQKYDIFYIIYFFSICFSYTFINGECPISYISRIIKNKKFSRESIDFSIENKFHFPEMESVLPIYLYPYINTYFIITTKIYFFTLCLVIHRNDLYNVIVFPFSVLFFYFLFFYLLYVGRHVTFRFLKYFKLYQQFTKVILMLTIYFLLESQRFMPLNFVARQLRNVCPN